MSQSQRTPAAPETGTAGVRPRVLVREDEAAVGREHLPRHIGSCEQAAQGARDVGHVADVACGIVAARALSSSGFTPRSMSVMIMPGAMALTRMPRLAYSSARARVSPMMPALEAL